MTQSSNSTAATESPIHVTLSTPSPIRQIDSLQILRALAVFIIVWGHTFPHLLPEGAWFPNLGIFGIDIFFALSGFILSIVVLRNRQAPGIKASWQFLLRRIIRIYPTYWLIGSITLVQLLRSHGLSILHLSGLLLLPFPEYPATHLLAYFSWTLVFEMFFYATLALLQLFTVRYAVQWQSGILLAFVLLGRLGSIHKPVIIIAANPMLLEFIFGSMVALIFSRTGTHPTLGKVLSAAGWLFAVFLCQSGFPSPALNDILFGSGAMLRALTWGIAGALVLGGMVFWSPESRNGLYRFMVVIGNASYCTYLISGLLLVLGSHLLIHYSPAHVSTTTVYVLGVSTVIAIFLAGWLMYQFIEWPLLHRLQKLLLPRKQSAQ